MLFIDKIYFLVSGQFAIVSYPDKFIVIVKISQLMNHNFFCQQDSSMKWFSVKWAKTLAYITSIFYYRSLFERVVYKNSHGKDTSKECFFWWVSAHVYINCHYRKTLPFEIHIILTKAMVGNYLIVLFIKTMSTTLPQIVCKLMLFFQSYFQKCDRSRRHSSSRSPGMNGLRKRRQLAILGQFFWWVLYFLESCCDNTNFLARKES